MSQCPVGGTKLLVRLRTGVSLTSTGQELLRFANESLTRLEEVEHRIRGLECDDVSSFVIGCHESLGAYFLPHWMSKFLESNPRIQLTLSNAPSRTVLNATVERGVHFGIVVNPEPHPDVVQIKETKERQLTELLRDHDQAFHSLQKLAPPRGAVAASEMGSDLKSLPLVNILVKLTCEEMHCRLDRIYLEQLHRPLGQEYGVEECPR